jgi:hypothetical protein
MLKLPIATFGSTEAYYRAEGKSEAASIEEFTIDPQAESADEIVPDREIAKEFHVTPRTLANWRRTDPLYNETVAPFQINGRWHSYRRRIEAYKNLIGTRGLPRAPPAK